MTLRWLLVIGLVLSAASCGAASTEEFDSVVEQFSGLKVNGDSAPLFDDIIVEERSTLLAFEFGGSAQCVMEDIHVGVCQELSGTWHALIYRMARQPMHLEGSLEYDGAEFTGEISFEVPRPMNVDCGLVVHWFSIDGAPGQVTGFGADSFEVVNGQSPDRSMRCHVGDLPDFDASTVSPVAPDGADCTAWIIAREDTGERIPEFGVSRCDAPAAFLILNLAGEQSSFLAGQLHKMPALAEAGIYAKPIALDSGCWVVYTLGPHNFGTDSPTFLPRSSVVVEMGDISC